MQRYLRGRTDLNPLLHFRENRDLPGIHPLPRSEEGSIAAEMRRFARPGHQFEELRPLSPTVRRRAKVLAYYLPQFHAIPENDRWWGKGFTEWSNLARGMPRFKGHYQPRIPRDLGFYCLDDIETMRRQVAMARSGGIHGFVFYYYWFNRQRLLERPVEAFLRHDDIDMPFCLMWANENWTRRWDGMEKEVLIAQDYRRADNAALVDDFARHFDDRRYIRIQGRPLLMVYRASLIPDTPDMVAEWRQLFRERHDEDPIFVMAQSFDSIDPRPLGFDGAIEFPPHKLTVGLQRINDSLDLLDDSFNGSVYDYDAVVKRALGEPPSPYPLIRTAVPSWDNDARRQGTGLALAHSTPEKYGRWLSALVERAQSQPFFGEPIVCVNAWNEWCEGAYLEPDQHFGAAYLNATAGAVAGLTALGGKREKLLLVGHDAFPGGAQHLLLNIGRTLKESFGFDIEFLLLAGGRLEDSYRAVAPLTVAGGRQDLADKVIWFRDQGIRHALCNTSATGAAAAALKAAGLRVMLLVHEMPRLLQEKQLEAVARNGITHADLVVFPNEVVRGSLLEALGIGPSDRHVIRPQGLYTIFEPDQEEGDALRRELGLGPRDHLVVSVGYGDMRKGFDLFFQTWRRMEAEGTRVHFAWVGALDPQLRQWMERELAEGIATGRFHLPGYRENVVPWLSAADAFLLTSREDPFPTVILEAMAADLPVFAFEGTGGAPELLQQRKVGHVAPYCDVRAMAQRVASVLHAPPDDDMLARARDMVAYEFEFGRYNADLVRALMPQLAPVSVVVPNFNYARHLRERLDSIFAQTHPIRELVVLDDASTDDSIDVIVETAEEAGRDIKLIANTSNSGSVFAQWGLGAEIASGEFIWIAEADDLADAGLLATVMPLMATDPSIGLAFVDSRAIDEEGNLVFESYRGYADSLEFNGLAATRIFEGRDFVERFLGIKNVIVNASAVIWRRDVLMAALERCGAELAGLTMAGDWRLYLEALSAPGLRIAYVAEPLNVHRRHGGSITHRLDPARHVSEILACQDVAVQKFNLAPAVLARQAEHRAEVERQLSPD
ncbi:MAG: lipopolysaccharide biosynthesis protein [Methylobacterium sp.]|nr:MAG: lipopolysaccharide biosynthesis protein [Methylobacterium sp.]